jgi:hypothetical protein
LHDLNHEWIGYFIHARDKTYLRFTVEGEWVGFST